MTTILTWDQGGPSFRQRLHQEIHIDFPDAPTCGHCAGSGFEPYSQTGVSCLYRHFGPDGTLLYVGITNNFLKRQSSHKNQSFWWHWVARISIEVFKSRTDVEQAEIAAIVSEKPLLNKAIGAYDPGSLDTPSDKEIGRRWAAYMTELSENDNAHK